MPPDNTTEIIPDRNSVIPRDTILSGKYVVLCSMQAGHLPRLFETMSGPGTEAIYDYIRYGPFEAFEPFQEFWSCALTLDSDLIFCIEDLQTGKLAGIADITSTSPKAGVLEIGFMFSPLLQKTVGATESFYLLAGKAFDVGCRRLEWKCDDSHIGSKRAAMRFGFTLEAVFRQHQIVKGRNRDTAWFSLLDGEWPNRKAALEAWIDAANFDESGIQRYNLLHFQKHFVNDLAEAPVS